MAILLNRQTKAQATVKRYLVFLAGVFICACGIALEVFADVTILPGEGIVKTLAESHKLGKFKAWVQK